MSIEAAAISSSLAVVAISNAVVRNVAARASCLRSKWHQGTKGNGSSRKKTKKHQERKISSKDQGVAS
jgi:hypothetical protein